VRLFTQSGEPFAISSLLIAGFTYIFMMLLTYGCAIPGGLFMPSVMVGGCLGRAVGQLVKFYVQDSVFSGAYALAGVLQCVAVCCNVLRCIAVSRSPYSVARMRSRRCVAVLLQCVAGCCRVLHCPEFSSSSVRMRSQVCCNVLQSVEVCYSALQCPLFGGALARECVAVCRSALPVCRGSLQVGCSVLQWVAGSRISPSEAHMCRV